MVVARKPLAGGPPALVTQIIGATEFLNHGVDKIADSAHVGDIEWLGEHFRLVLAANRFGDGR